MKHIIVGLSVFACLFFVASCGGEEKTDESFKYAYNEESSVMEWTAFKYSNKTPVKGTFTKIKVTAISEASSAEDLVESLGFTIPVSSIETNDQSRNAKIIEFFFATIATEELSGRLKSIEKDGTAILEVKMNGITKDVKGTYTLKDTFFALNATMNVLDFNADQAIANLNAACATNHTGEDGVLKLWSDVDLSFTTVLTKK